MVGPIITRVVLPLVGMYAIGRIAKKVSDAAVLASTENDVLRAELGAAMEDRATFSAMADKAERERKATQMRLAEARVQIARLQDVLAKERQKPSSERPSAAGYGGAAQAS